jgi:hypothetical protein
MVPQISGHRFTKIMIRCQILEFILFTVPDLGGPQLVHKERRRRADQGEEYFFRDAVFLRVQPPRAGEHEM